MPVVAWNFPRWVKQLGWEEFLGWRLVCVFSFFLLLLLIVECYLSVPATLRERTIICVRESKGGGGRLEQSG